ncbi:MAG: PLP-dependent aspartate aminotransferase family protein [Patescibacteria group bacterium]
MKYAKGFSTKTIHIGNEPDLDGSGDVVVPIHLSTTFARRKVDKPSQGYEYSRSGNPTRYALEKNLAALENGKYAFTYASGLAAITNILLLLKSGDNVVSIDDVYGGTRRLFTRVFEKYNITFTFVNFISAFELKTHIQRNTKMIWIESPTNPLMKIVDIASITRSVRSKKILTVVDNTFATPYFQKPLDLGTDIVVHSMTKYLGGHSDTIGGSVIVNDNALAERLKFLQNAVGAILSPFDSYQILKGIKTLPLRMEKHEENAIIIAKFLKQNRKVKKVYYPGLPDHPNHKIAKKQMSGFGGMISFELKGTMKTAVAFLEHLQLIAIAESLGAVESLIEHPASMTHASVPKEEREKIGLSDTLIRLSVGIEDVDDIIHDIFQALSYTKTKERGEL